MGHRINQAGARRARSKRFSSRLARSTDSVLLLLCLAGLGMSAGDEQLVNGIRLVAAMIQRHARTSCAARETTGRTAAASRSNVLIH